MQAPSKVFSAKHGGGKVPSGLPRPLSPYPLTSPPAALSCPEEDTPAVGAGADRAFPADTGPHQSTDERGRGGRLHFSLDPGRDVRVFDRSPTHWILRLNIPFILIPPGGTERRSQHNKATARGFCLESQWT